MSRQTPREEIADTLRIRPGARVHLADKAAGKTLGWEKEQAQQVLDENRQLLGQLQYKLYADRRFALLVVLQAIDGGGKDSTTRHVMSAFNPQGCTVTSFKVPSEEERHHDYLWRIHKHAPMRGEIAVFNRSHYEEVLVVRVDKLVPPAVWSRRYDEINSFERMLCQNDTRVVKLFLHISKDEQKRRFEERLRNPQKHWKFEPADLEKRAQWNDYRKAFEAALSRCSTQWAPWYIIPADSKWFRDFAVSQILLRELQKLPLHFPPPAYDPSKVRIP